MAATAEGAGRGGGSCSTCCTAADTVAGFSSCCRACKQTTGSVFYRSSAPPIDKGSTNACRCRVSDDCTS